VSPSACYYREPIQSRLSTCLSKEVNLVEEIHATRHRVTVVVTSTAFIWNISNMGKYVSEYIYEGVSKSFRTESIKKYTLAKINTRWEATQRVMAAKLTTPTHKIAIQLHLVAESCTICSSRSRRPVLKLLDAPSYNIIYAFMQKSNIDWTLRWQVFCERSRITRSRNFMLLRNQKFYHVF
jgi:hypothetical protein